MELTSTNKDVHDYDTKCKLVMDELEKFDFMEYEVYDRAQRLGDISLIMNSLLPDVSDLILFEIDDLLYTNISVPIKKLSGIKSYDWWCNIFKKWMQPFSSLYRQLHGRFASYRYVADMTCLQLVEHLCKHFDEDIWKYIITDIFFRFISSHYEYENITFFMMKLLRIISNENSDVILKFITDKHCDKHRNYTEKLISMIKLKNIPQAKHPDKRRMTNWLSTQANKLSEKVVIYFPTISSIKDNILVYLMMMDDWDKNDVLHEKYYMKLLHGKRVKLSRLMLLLIIYKYFTSAKNETHKMERLKTFVWKFIHEKNKFEKEMSHFLNFSANFFTDKYLKELIRSFNNSFENKHLKKCYKGSIKPYLSDRINQSETVTKENISDTESSNECRNISDEPDFTIEKYLLYDNLVKGLQCLNIIIIAFTKCFECDWFKKKNRDIKVPTIKAGIIHSYLIDMILDPSERGEIPWFADIALDCPTMYLISDNEYLIEDVKKMWKGEDIGDATEEKIYFAISRYYG